MKIILCDRNVPLVEAWRAEAQKYVGRGYEISVVHGEIFQEATKAHAIVSPANSFGFMDGGIDQVYTNRFGNIQAEVQRFIQDQFDGELLVGQAYHTRTGDPNWPFLISAPTMRVPVIITDHTDVYLATRAAVRHATSMGGVSSILFPGMGTGVGAVSSVDAAYQMLKGIDEAFHPRPFPVTLGEATGRQNNSIAEAYRKMIGR